MLNSFNFEETLLKRDFKFYQFSIRISNFTIAIIIEIIYFFLRYLIDFIIKVKGFNFIKFSLFFEFLFKFHLDVIMITHLYLNFNFEFYAKHY